jgi:CRISPR-associated protein Cas2
MHVIIVYDVGVDRVGRVCNFLRTYLTRIQNSVFEGDITEARLARLKAGLEKIIETEHDSILIWVLRDARWADRQVMGVERFPISNII